MTASPIFPLSGETRTDARSSGRTVPGDITSPPSPGTKTIYGVIDPGFPKGWEPCSFIPDEACANFFRRRGVPTDFGILSRAVIWTDRNDNVRVAVAHYHNGKAVTLRWDRHGDVEVSFEDLAL